jgi:hypothetical protein
MKKRKGDFSGANLGEGSPRRRFIKKLVLCAGGITISRSIIAGAENADSALRIKEEADFLNSLPQESRAAVEILKQIQAYDPKVITDLIGKLSKDVVVLKTTQSVKGDSRYLTQTITIKDPEALAKLNMSRISGANRSILEAGKLLQQSTMMADPKVISETKNLLPEGMVAMSPGGTALGVNIGVNFNLGKVQKLNQSEWTPVNLIK